MRIYSTTLKYFRIAIYRFLKDIQDLRHISVNDDVREQIDDLLEAYVDIGNKIDSFNLNYEDPNKMCDGEPHAVEIEIPEKMIESLSMLTHRMLISWRDELGKLEKKDYKTQQNNERIYKLRSLIGPLEALFQNKGFLLNNYMDNGPLIFPGELESSENVDEPTDKKVATVTIFSATLLKAVPKDIAALCEEFNFNYEHAKSNACILLLRRILPLAVVRKFQAENLEEEIKKDGEFFNTKELLGKVERFLSAGRFYKDIVSYKILIDSSQHSFTIKFDITDITGPALAIKVFLDDLF